jgi:hypothetical protein
MFSVGISWNGTLPERGGRKEVDFLSCFVIIET